MNDGYFSIKRDLEIVRAGGFFCQGCLVGKPMDDKSPDPRYCLSCYEFLLAESALLSPNRGKPSWVPVSDKATALQDKREVVTKLPHKGVVGCAVPQQGGRPRKKGGEPVSRMTKWRRKKELQGVLV